MAPTLKERVWCGSSPIGSCRHVHWLCARSTASRQQSERAVNETAPLHVSAAFASFAVFAAAAAAADNGDGDDAAWPGEKERGRELEDLGLGLGDRGRGSLGERRGGQLRVYGRDFFAGAVVHLVRHARVVRPA